MLTVQVVLRGSGCSFSPEEDPVPPHRSVILVTWWASLWGHVDLKRSHWSVPVIVGVVTGQAQDLGVWEPLRPGHLFLSPTWGGMST